MRKILVIENNQDILDILIYVLEEDGYEVVTSAGAGILQYTAQLKPDLILLDERLIDHENGIEHCRKLKTHTATRHIPVLMLSASKPDQQVMTDARVDGYIKKPFDIEALNGIIQNALTVK